MQHQVQAANGPLKLLWVNPVTTSAWNAPMAELIAKVKLPQTEVHVVSLDLGEVQLTNLEHRTFESAIWFPVTALARQAAEAGFDGYGIGCFYDTALDEAREISGDMVVCGPCQSAVQIISNLCNRFSVVIGQEKWKVQMDERIRHYGYGRNLASFRAVGLGVDDFQVDKARTEGRIRDAVAQAIREDKAEGIILGCTLEFGFFQELQAEFGVPVIDAVYACFKGTEYAALHAKQFGWKPSRMWSCEPPSEAALAASRLVARAPLVGDRVVALADGSIIPGVAGALA